MRATESNDGTLPVGVVAAPSPKSLWIAVVMVSEGGVFVVSAQPELQPVQSQTEAAALTLDLIDAVAEEMPSNTCLYAVYLRRDVPRGDLLHHLITAPGGRSLLNHPDVAGSLLPGLGGNLSHFGWWARGDSDLIDVEDFGEDFGEDAADCDCDICSGRVAEVLHAQGEALDAQDEGELWHGLYVYVGDA